MLADSVVLWIHLIVSMDANDDCEQVRRPKHDIATGDVFVVKSDGFSGKVTSDPNKQPAECSIGFNFGDRLLSVAVVDWSCDHVHHPDRGADWNDRGGGGGELTLTRQPARPTSYHDIEPFLSVFADCDGKQKTLLVSMVCQNYHYCYMCKLSDDLCSKQVERKTNSVFFSVRNT